MSICDLFTDEGNGFRSFDSLFKVDNIYDLSLKELEKIPIIEDLSKILGVQPRRKGDILPDRILGLTDADLTRVCLYGDI